MGLIKTILNLLLADGLKLFDDFLCGSGSKKAHNDDDDCGDYECGQQLVYREDTAERSDEVLPDEHHHAADEHAAHGAPLIAALPEQAEQHHRAVAPKPTHA